MTARSRDDVVVHLDTAGHADHEIGLLHRSGTGQRADISFEYATAWLDDRRTLAR